MERVGRKDSVCSKSCKSQHRNLTPAPIFEFSVLKRILVEYSAVNMDSNRNDRIRYYETLVRDMLRTTDGQERLNEIIREINSFWPQQLPELVVSATRRPRTVIPAVKIDHEDRENSMCCICLDNFQVIVHAKELPCTVSIHCNAKLKRKI